MDDAATAIELTVSIKGEDQTFKKKFLIYSQAFMSHHDEFVKECIDEAKKECKFEIEEIRVRASF